MAQYPLTVGSVPGGLAASRRRLRRMGPVVALVLPGLVLVASALVSRSWECDGTACWTKGGVNILLRLLATPTLLLVGFPVQGGDTRLAVAIVTSTLLWLALGAWAARRANRSPVASWREWWREYLVLLIALWGGVIASLAVVRAVQV